MKKKDSKKMAGTYFRTEEWRRKKSESLTGRKHTPEAIEKIRQASLGREVSEETREKLRIKSSGRKHTEESIEKMRVSHSNMSIETRNKMSDSQTGKVIPIKTRNKISKTLKGKKKPKGFGERVGATQKGKIVSQETRNKLSEATVQHQLNHNGWKSNTKPELETKKILEDNNINFKSPFCVKADNGKLKMYDVFVPDYNLLIEVDGIYWHSKNKKDNEITNKNLLNNRINDKFKNQLAKNKGFRLLRVWEDEIKRFENLVKNDFLGLEYMEIQNLNCF